MHRVVLDRALQVSEQDVVHQTAAPFHRNCYAKPANFGQAAEKRNIRTWAPVQSGSIRVQVGSA
jgi:hypothetical protein